MVVVFGLMVDAGRSVSDRLASVSECSPRRSPSDALATARCGPRTLPSSASVSARSGAVKVTR